MLKLVTLILTQALSFGAPTPKVETYSDIIDKAYNLNAQKDRGQAVLLLVNSIKKESKRNPKAARELMKTLEQIASVFWTDKGQQLYELGISLKNSDPQLALSKINEAAKIEVENLQIKLAQNRINQALGECKTALAQAQKMKEENPYSEEIDLLVAQSAVCSGQFEIFLKTKAQFDEKKLLQSRYWSLVESEYMNKTGNFLKAFEISKVISKNHSQFPESYYWNWKNSAKLNDVDWNSASKYLSLCKSLTAKDQREYLSEPLLCRRTQEVEGELKKTSAQGKE